uniref:RAB6-interacting golgin n=1 Tax=Aplanochytrium stocchinoi TaxID=215587 RepID=A0A7S3LM13_9STRA|mmetsp:Transcript_9370/g.11669  ORF Transcript_9370/g.11669 Transcript_9370/m.11669 type:complete len:232 (+) Transcript_9370:277-972(+)|eukprot:CAMPEP_0204827666 /NCGR_PEP_ID=MMETSP1346-20131115/5101_1 /ASSEMBLY_ACC=CAM_ASM_000771 /TAXON_ID=215587 /ORGANISM="Aplanochytrium stocchinoi, Strain GSBS06" /LENGTH=231 /DNA_ID=CAMNT_0051956175 /DNA_START=603 /DNA_END=1298 /DNA_ORIENTATION=+
MFDPKYCRGDDVDAGDKNMNNDEKTAEPVTKMNAENLKISTVAPDERKKSVKKISNASNSNNSNSSSNNQQQNDQSAFEEDPFSTKLQEKVKRQEKIVRGELGKKFNQIQEESRKLAQIQNALETLEKEQQKDIDILRTRIERVEREVSANRQIFQRKEKEYRDSKSLFEESEKEKEMLTTHLRLIIFENEKKKEQKLNQLMSQLGMGSNNNQAKNAEGFKGFPSSGKGMP